MRILRMLVVLGGGFLCAFCGSREGPKLCAALPMTGPQNNFARRIRATGVNDGEAR